MIKNQSNFVKYFILCAIIFLFIFTPLLEKKYYILIQFIDQCFILISILIILIFYKKIFIKINYLDLFFPSLFFLSIVSSVFAKAKYQSFLITFDLFIFILFLILIKQIITILNIQTILFSLIISNFILSLIYVMKKFFPSQEFLMHFGLANDNVAALFILIGIIYSFSFANRIKYFSSINIFLFLFLIASIAAELIISSRSIYAIVILTFSVFLALSKNKLLKVFYIIIVFLSLIGVIYKFQKSPFSWERINIWKASIKMLSDNLWLGVSPGNYSFYALQYNFPTYEYPARYLKYPNHAHSQWLHVICETGILSAFLIFAFVYYFFISCKNYRKRDLLDLKTLLVLLSFLIFAFFNNFFDSYAATFALIFSIILFERGENFYFTFKIENKNQLIMIQFFIIWVLIILAFIPYLAHYYYEKSIDFYLKSNINKAKKLINSSINLIPINSYYFRQRAAVLSVEFENTGNINLIPLIIKDYRQAKFINPLDYNSYIEEADFYKFLSSKLHTPEFLFNAIADYKAAILINPYNPFYHYYLSEIYSSINEFKKAAEELQKAINIEPNFINGYYRLYQLYSKLNNSREAKNALSKATDLANKYRYYPKGKDEYLNNLLRIPPELLYKASPF